MILDVMRPSITVTQPLLALTDQQLLHEVPHDEVGGGGPGDPAEEDVLVEFFVVVEEDFVVLILDLPLLKHGLRQA